MSQPATFSQTSGVSSWTSVLKEAVHDWSEHRAPTLGAALAYYAAFSLAPLLVITLALVGLAFGEEATQGELRNQLRQLMGPQVAAGLEELVAAARKPSEGITAAIIGGVMLLIGASGVFGQLQDSLNIIWDVHRKSTGGIMQLLRDRFFSFTLVLGTAFLLLVSLLLSATLNFFAGWIARYLPQSEILMHAGNAILSFAIVTLLFAMIFKFVPDAKITWRDVWPGAILTAVLFTLGKWGLGVYLGRSAVASAFGAAGSLVLVLLWVYYSSQILFFGAEFTQAYSRLNGSRQPR